MPIAGKLVVALGLAGLAGLALRDGREPFDDDDEPWIEARLDDLKAHLAKQDPALAARVAVVADVKLLPDDAPPHRLPSGKVGSITGKFQHRTGTLWISRQDARGYKRSRPSMLMTLLHEMAHAVHGPTKNFDTHMPHGNHWNDTWMELLYHATQHMGWDVEARCAECTYYGLCDASQCPRCRFAQKTCDPYQGGSPSDFKRKSAWEATKRPS